LLLGLPSYSYYAALGPNISETSTTFSAFAQDSWQVARRSRSRPGLRWEVHPPFQEQSGNIANFDHRTGDVIIPDHSLPPAPAFLAAIDACAGTNAQSCTKVLTASQAGLGQSLRKTYFGNWNPRVGFAWQPWADRKTVVRGAIGGYTQALLGLFAYAMTGVATSDIRTFSNDQGPNRPPAFRLPAATPLLSSLGLIGTEAFFDGTDPTMKDPRSWQWDFTIEREMPWRSALRASYTGVQTAGLAVRTDFNQVHASAIAFSASRVPFAQWGNLISLQGLGFANYQGMTLEWSRRMRGDLFLTPVTRSPRTSAKRDRDGTVFRSGESQLRADRSLQHALRSRRFDGRAPQSIPADCSVPAAVRARACVRWKFARPRTGNSGGMGAFDDQPDPVRAVSNADDRCKPGPVEHQHRVPRLCPAGSYPERKCSNPTPDQYYDRTAFAPAPVGAGRFGNAGGRHFEGTWHGRHRRRAREIVPALRETAPAHGSDVYEPAESSQFSAAECQLQLTRLREIERGAISRE